MRANSKVFFRESTEALTLAADREEKESLVLFLMEHAFGVTRAAVYAEKEMEVDIVKWTNWMERVNKGEPVQYITEKAWFANRWFRVTPDVLIPRPETEELVFYIWKRIAAAHAPVTLLDIGTGSGCMGVSLARLTGAAVVATDISAKALEVAAYNAAQQNVDVSFLQHDITTHPLPAGGFDWVVSNPPYISEAERDGMKANVLNYEPHLALFVPGEPLLFYRHIAARSKPVLKAGGHVAVEINEHFAKEVMAVFAAEGYTAVQCLQDISGKDRMVVARMA